jgi:hypothetical protein
VQHYKTILAFRKIEKIENFRELECLNTPKYFKESTFFEISEPQVDAMGKRGWGC